MKYSKTFLAGSLAALLALTSCGSSSKLTTDKVAYQSIRTTHGKAPGINNDMKIYATYGFTADGELVAVVYNPTSEIMVIDQTMSFFVNTSGESKSYYDPTVRTTSVSDLSSKSNGASVNLGSVAGALGIGGRLGGLLGGMNVGGGTTTGQTVTNATYIADQPKVSLGPRSSITMSKTFQVTGIGSSGLKSTNAVMPNMSYQESTKKFSICISYSLDGGNTFEKMVTDFYVNSEIASPVMRHGAVNDALRGIFIMKNDAIHEPMWFLHFVNNIASPSDIQVEGTLFDYQF